MPWVHESGRLTGLFLVCLVLGYLSGAPATVFALACAAYLAWTLYQLRRLETWLAADGNRAPPVLPGAWRGVYRQITELERRGRRRKHKLGKHLKRFRQSTSALPDATVVVAADGTIEWLNGAAGRLLGLRVPEDVGRPIRHRLPGTGFQDCLREAGCEEPVDLPSPVDPGRTLSVRVVRFAKHRFLLIARDVTRIQRLERVRRDFVANVSHEMRTPLTVLMGYLESMADKASQCPPPWRGSLRAMTEQTHRLHRLVEDLMQLARLESDDAAQVANEVVAAPAVIAAMVEDARMVSRGAHVLEERIDAQLWLRGNAEQLRSVVSNLLSNAVRYTPEGGRIGVRWHAGSEGPCLEVCDTGLGIPPEHLGRLTERFYRVDVGRSRASGGTGLGLAIVKHAASLMEGVLSIESTPGEGSTFRVQFPESRRLPPAPARAPAQLAMA